MNSGVSLARRNNSCPGGVFVTALIILLFAPSEAFSQGCPPARLMCPTLGSQTRTYLEPREWMMTVSYRHYLAFRDYQGGESLTVPSPPEIYARTHVNVMDLTLTRAFTDRWSLSFELPFLRASRETYAE